VGQRSAGVKSFPRFTSTAIYAAKLLAPDPLKYEV
jgi:hypothetical protein